jgi:hypothetical protein
MPKLFFCVLILISLVNVSFAQNEEEIAVKPKSQKLPRAFTAFSNDDLLKKIFPDYDARTGRVASRLNEAKQPSLVRINQARLWWVDKQEYLVTLVDIAGHDSLFTDLCGNCGMFAVLAVLKKENNQLLLVARQQTPKYSMPADFFSNHIDAIFYTGHAVSVSLDLAPYKLSSKEMLIGFRIEHMWLPARTWDVYLALYRIEGNNLREVFNEAVVERRYPSEYPRGEIIKTVSELSPILNGAKFYNYEIRKTITHCLDHDDDDCGSKSDKIKQVKTQTELWQFNQTRFEKVKK